MRGVNTFNTRLITACWIANKNMNVRNFAATAKCTNVDTARGEVTFVAKCPSGETATANRPGSNTFTGRLVVVIPVAYYYVMCND